MKIDLNKFHFKQFAKAERSSFPYWYYHWKAFNLTALSLGVWKPKHLLHDIEKPWLRLFWDYSKVQKWHRLHNSHHADYIGGIDQINWLDLIIDNECSRLTKINAQMTAREYINFVLEEKENISEELKTAYRNKALPLLDKLGL